MPQLIEFGGTEGVSVLDLGLPGGAIAGAGNGRSTLQIAVGDGEESSQVRAMPDSNIALLHRLGFKGRVITGRGQLVLNGHTLMNSVEGAIADHKFDPDEFVPTLLTDNVGGRNWYKTCLLMQ